jgi:hypothetical protein
LPIPFWYWVWILDLFCYLALWSYSLVLYIVAYRCWWWDCCCFDEIFVVCDCTNFLKGTTLRFWTIRDWKYLFLDWYSNCLRYIPRTCVQNFRSFAQSAFSNMIILIVKNDPKFRAKIAQEYDFQFISEYIFNILLHIVLFQMP